jgi:hypothetical protein
VVETEAGDEEVMPTHKVKFEIVFRQRQLVIARVHNEGHEVELTEEVASKIIETEQFLEKLTGIRVHINTLS